MDKKNVVAFEFERFVMSVIQQKCILQNRPFFCEFTTTDLSYISEFDVRVRDLIAHHQWHFDAYAPKVLINFKDLFL